jgi:hypothetical protein
VTERWRKRLGDLDKESPGDDVYERSKGGPQLPEEAIVRPSTSSRVVTGVAAFLIFALAISVFAIPALRLREGAGGQPLAGIQPLWPWQTVDEVEEFTDDPSPVGVVGSQEFFEPEGTAWAFGHEVLGWSDAQITDLTAGQPSVPFCEMGTPVRAPSATGTVGSVGCGNYGVGIPEPANATAYASLSHPPPTPPGWGGCIDFCGEPTPAPTAPGSPSPSPYRYFAVTAGTDVCPSSGRCVTPMAIVTVYQPLATGDGNAWAVLSAETPSIDLSVGVGSVIDPGMSITSSARVPTGAAPSLGLVVGAGDCRVTVPTTAVSSTQMQPNGVVAFGMRIDVALPPRPVECSETEPGYVFAAFAEEGVAPGPDPAREGPSGPLFGFAAVPVVVEWSEGAPPETGTGPLPTVTPTVAPLEWITYTDPLGWTIDVPSSWSVEPFEATDARTLTSRSGARFFTGTLDVGGGPATGEVLVTVSHDQGPPSPMTADDSAFPLSADDLERNEGGRQLSFRGDGLPFILDVRGGTTETLELSGQQEQIVRRMIDSIRFEPWQPGDPRNGWTSLGPLPLANATITWIQLEGGDWGYAVIDPGLEGARRFFGAVAPPCPGATFDAREDATALVFCGDRSVAGWSLQGEPLAENPPELREQLLGSTAIRSWDGALLVPV